MEVKEIVNLKDGRQITMTLTEEEHRYLISWAINELLARGAMVIGSHDGPEVIGTEDAVEQMNIEEGHVKTDKGTIQ